MPALTRWFLKSSLLYLAVGLLSGAAQAALAGFVSEPTAASLRSASLHLLTVGWITQMIFGVAYWMFPRHSRDRPRRSATLGWAAYALLNAGLLLRTAGEPLHAALPNGRWGALLALGALLQALAGAAFVLNTWSRVRGR